MSSEVETVSDHEEEFEPPDIDEDVGSIIDIDKLQRTELIEERFDENFRAGFVSIIGSPNVGKSTLMNRLIGDKLSIVTSKAQTTRHQIRGIISGENFQIIYNDTPGVLLPKYELHEGMMAYVKEAINDADLILFLTDIFESDFPDKTIFERIDKQNKPLIVAINKIDLLSNQMGPVKISPEKEKDIGSLNEISNRWKEIFPSAFICPISASEGTGTEKLLNEIQKHLPKSPPLYPPDSMSDRPMRFFASEIIREQVFSQMSQEIPYCSEVVIDKFEEREHMISIAARIIVSRETQKGMVIGKNGKMIKNIGIEARKSLENFFGTKIFLKLNVSVDKEWRKNTSRLKEYGYM